VEKSLSEVTGNLSEEKEGLKREKRQKKKLKKINKKGREVKIQTFSDMVCSFVVCKYCETFVDLVFSRQCRTCATHYFSNRIFFTFLSQPTHRSAMTPLVWLLLQ
jgi:hypothetical protein